MRMRNFPVMVLAGEMGVGKTAIAGTLATNHASVVACHFCTSRSEGSLDPYEFVLSIVRQLQKRVPGFAEVVANCFPGHPRRSAGDAFRQLVIQPTRRMADFQ